MPDERRRRLKDLETVIASGFDGVVAQGRALREIRDDGLYLEVGAGTFEQYVKSRWSIAVRTAYQQIDATDIHDAVSAQIAQTPMLPFATEGVARELAPILHQQGPAKVAEAWGKVSAAYAGQRPPTAGEVHRILVAEGYREKPFSASSGTVSRRIRLGQYGDKLIAAEKRLDWFIAKELGDKPLPERDKRLVVDYAEKCERMSRLLREMT
jgi:hypothetical protein